jgi:PAS domain S-box-containing protein
MCAELKAQGLAALIQERDWGGTPLGPRERWPGWLSNTVDTCLGSGFPVALFIGPDHRLLYNDRYAELIGSKHPRALGEPGASIFPEVWETLGAMLESVAAGKGPIRREDFRFHLRRGTASEECYFTFSFSAITDDHGAIHGALCVFTETTAQVIVERRMRTLYGLSSELMRATSGDQVSRACERVLSQNPSDLPFVILYEQEAGSPVNRKAMVGIARDDLELWLGEWASAGLISGWWKIGGLGPKLERLGLTPDRRGNAHVDEAVVLTSASGRGRPGTVLVAGVNPLRPFDMEYLSFLRLVLGQITSALGTVRAYESEKRRAEEMSALEREKSRYSETLRTVLDSLPGTIETFDRDWNYTYANDQALAFFDMAREEVIGRNLWRDWPYFTRTPLYAASMQALSEERPVTVEWFCEQSQRWLETRISPGPTMVSMSTVRIDERKETERIVRSRVREQEAIAQVGNLALLQPDIDVLMRKAVEVVATTLGVPRAAVVEIQRGRGGLLVRVEHGFPDGLKGQRLKSRKSLSGYTLATGKSVVVHDLARETRFSSPSLAAWGVAAGIGVIIAGPDHTPYGVLLALTTEPREFPGSFVPFLEAIANVLGAAIQRRHAEEALARERAQLEMRVRERTQGLRQANRRLRSLSKRLLEIQEQERRHIARELHDEIGQALTIVKMDLYGFDVASANQAMTVRVREDIARLDNLLAQIRSLALDLGLSALDDLGLVAALRSYARRIAERAGLQLTFDVVGDERRLPDHLETAAYRIGQEAITNMVRHARAKNVMIEVRFGSGIVTLTIQDDGCGFNAPAILNATEGASSMGLFGMQERAALAGGALEIRSSAGSGTTVRVKFPMEDTRTMRRRRAV